MKSDVRRSLAASLAAGQFSGDATVGADREASIRREFVRLGWLDGYGSLTAKAFASAARMGVACRVEEPPPIAEAAMETVAPVIIEQADEVEEEPAASDVEVIEEPAETPPSKRKRRERSKGRRDTEVD